MSPWAYFNRPTNMAFHDLTTKIKPPKNIRSLLGLSLKFIPRTRWSVPWSYFEGVSLPRFERDFRIKTYIAGRIDEDGGDDTNPFNPRLYVRTTWKPPDYLFPNELPRRINAFKEFLKGVAVRKKCASNLLPHQRKALDYLRNQTAILVVQCDKNLGPAIIERDEYIKLVIRDHLSDSRTYQRLSPSEINLEKRRLPNMLDEWMKKYHKDLTRNERRFLKHHIVNNKEPFATFYATMKVHKMPLRTRPIVSCSGSLLYALGVWVDDKLQIAARAQRSYFKSSFNLNRELSALHVPRGCTLFVADAESMYTNIPTHWALNRIGIYLNKNYFPGIPVRALMDALRIVMKNNIFTFGDTVWKQTTGTAMGTPPAPPWATLYYALNEDTFLPKFDENLVLYRRFIDDVFGIWKVTDAETDAATWESFKRAMNSEVYQLKWIVSDRTEKVDFMDLTISLKETRLHTTLYEKPSNLHLYIPAHSSHPPGLLAGMIHGMVYRINMLCSDTDDKKKRINAFFQQLQRRGYSNNKLRPHFQKALARIQNSHQPSDQADN